MWQISTKLKDDKEWQKSDQRMRDEARAFQLTGTKHNKWWLSQTDPDAATVFDLLCLSF
jgi:hypothetical protein